MRPGTLPLAMLAALSGCVEPELEPAVEPTADTGLAADGDPLADGGAQGGDSIVEPGRSRIELTIAAAGSLEPGADVELTVGGVAREQIDSGEVVLTLPTRALMDHVGKGDPELPSVASWELPAMAEGGTWSGTYTVPGEAAGWYRVMANAYTRGPDGGPWLSDDVLREAWMHVSETDGRLTRILKDSVAPLAGPAAGWPVPLARNPDYPFLHPDTVYLRVVYTVSEREGFRPAVEARVEAELWKEGGGDRDLGFETVPEDGIVAFPCPPKGWVIVGEVHAPETDLVQGRKDIALWATRTCGALLEVEVLAHRYYPWRLLNLAADTLQKHFGHTRGRINWGLRFDGGRSYYKWAPFYEKITLNWHRAPDPDFFFTVAHEYGHALHSKALGGMWGTDKCGEEDRLSIFSVTSYTCAFSEGFADYAGTVGSGHLNYETCFEYLGTPKALDGGCQTVSHDRKPEIEAWVAALFTDLIDDNSNLEGLNDDASDDLTHYSGYYVAGVFRSCEAKRGSFLDRWKGRSRVYDFVWCLEEYVHKPTHERVFPDEPVPDTAKHKRPPHRPDNWWWGDIRETWLRNLAKEGR